MLPVPLMIAWAVGKRWLLTAWNVWVAMPWPVKCAIVAAVALFIGRSVGLDKGRAECAARIEQSIAAAERRDVEIAEKRAAVAAQQATEAEARARAVEGEVRSYVDELAKRTGESCRAGADADRYNDGLSVQDDGVQPPRAKPAPGGQHRSNARPVPARNGK